MTCPFCKTTIDRTATKCDRCGAPFVMPKPEPILPVRPGRELR